MNRRELMVTGAATAVVASLPTLPALATQRVFWGPGAITNPHADLVLDYIMDAFRNGRINAKEDYYGDLFVELRNPIFHIAADNKVFACMTGGYTDEPGLSLTIIEDGIKIGPMGIGSTHGAKSYPEQYYVRRPWLPYADEARNALGDRVSYNFDWFYNAVDQMKAAKAVA